MEFPSPRPRRVSTPRWLDLRLVLGIVLVLAAVLVGAVVVSRARHTDKELAVTRDLAAGTRLRASDLRLVDVQLPDDVRHDAAYLSDPDQAVGKVLDRPLRKGELVPAAVLAAAPHRHHRQRPVRSRCRPDAHARPADRRVAVDQGLPRRRAAARRHRPGRARGRRRRLLDLRRGPGRRAQRGPAARATRRGALAIEDATIRAGVLTGAGPGSSGTLPALDACGPSSTP